jgi:hypothetical protein
MPFLRCALRAEEMVAWRAQPCEEYSLAALEPSAINFTETGTRDV